MTNDDYIWGDIMGYSFHLSTLFSFSIINIDLINYVTL